MPSWEIFAIRYAAAERMACTNFADPAEFVDQPMPIDFYVWLLRAGDRCILVDTGFNAMAAPKRNRHLLCDPVGVIGDLGLAPGGIGDVVLTHLHYDHAGNLDVVPTARLHVQAREMAFAAGPPMCDPAQRHFVEADDVAAVVHALHGGRVSLHQGDAEIAPGVSLHLIGGHTDGMQVVRVMTARGAVVLASDATHYYANMLLSNPFPAIWNRADMIEGYKRLRMLADSEDHIIPGHDPQVRSLYPPLIAGQVDPDIVCLHYPPHGRPRVNYLLAHGAGRKEFP